MARSSGSLLTADFSGLPHSPSCTVFLFLPSFLLAPGEALACLLGTEAV